jgi:MFS family permease
MLRVHTSSFIQTIADIRFWTIYPLSIIYIFHSLLVAFINSTYMEQFLSPAGVGVLFTIGSALSVLTFIFFTPLLQTFGNNKLTIILALLDIASLIVMGLAITPAITIVAFLVFLAVNPLLFLSIDIYSETIIGTDESATGSRRGLTLTLMSGASMLAPLAMGFIAGPEGDLARVYFISAGIFSLFILYIIITYRNFIDPIYTNITFRNTLRKIRLERDVWGVCSAHFLLQFFFSWMIIFSPLYLNTVLGYSWDQIGLILAVALSAYVIFEYPVGFIADKYIGEKEIMALGFLILAVSSSWIAFMTAAATIYAWMLLMFSTRVGAAFVETTTESYFFKHTTGSDADLINFFRILRPLANVLGALLGGLCVYYFEFSFLFIILGFLMIPGLFFTMNITDTK